MSRAAVTLPDTQLCKENGCFTVKKSKCLLSDWLLDGMKNPGNVAIGTTRQQENVGVLRHNNVRPQLELKLVPRSIESGNEPLTCAVLTQKRKLFVATESQLMRVPGIIV